MKFEQLAYHTDSSELFRCLAHLPHAVLLDSCHPYSEQGRFDIMSALPYHVITEQPFEQLPKHLQQQPHTAEHAELPFTVGAIGYLSYDLGYALEEIHSQTKTDINMPQTIIGCYDWSIVTDHHAKKTWLCYTEEHTSLTTIQALLNNTPPSEPTFELSSRFQSNFSQQQYAAAFAKIQQHLHAGDCYQVNLCQRFSAHFSGSTWQAYQLLRKINPAPFAGYLNYPQGQILSFSPERFLKIQQGRVEAKPIKGTMPRSADQIKDQQYANTLLNSSKDRAENTMIVDLLRNDLGKICLPGSVAVPKLCDLESFSNVHHLVSTVTGQLQPNTHAMDCLRDCFPGGSITGAPKHAAMQIIDQLEPHHRSIYCGSIGYWDRQGNMDCNIPIRTLIACQQQLHCYAGGGIVLDSDMASEYEESLQKVRRLIEALETSAQPLEKCTSDLHHTDVSHSH